jgi:hypothetical protein
MPRTTGLRLLLRGLVLALSKKCQIDGFHKVASIAEFVTERWLGASARTADVCFLWTTTVNPKDVIGSKAIAYWSGL